MISLRSQPMKLKTILPYDRNTKFCKWLQEACECQGTPQPRLPRRAIITAAWETGEDDVKFKARLGY